MKHVVGWVSALAHGCPGEMNAIDGKHRESRVAPGEAKQRLGLR